MRRERITITLRSDIIKKVDSTVDGLRARNRSNAIENILLKEFNGFVMQQAVILAGKTTKINGQVIPKILMPIGNETLIEKNIATLKNLGVTQIIILTEDQEKTIKSFLGDGSRFDVEIIYKHATGTASFLREARNYITTTFLMFNGDILLEGHDIEDMHDFHKKSKTLGTLAVTTTKEASKLGSVFMKGHAIVGFKEKTSTEQSYVVSAGIYLLEPAVCELVGNGFQMVEDHLFPRLAEEHTLTGYHLHMPWHHLHDETALKDYLKTLKK